jgi:DNA-binding MarR family transcriptional regulator
MPDSVEVLGRLFRDVHRGMFEATKNVAQQYGLSAPGMRVMGLVMERPGITVSELSRERGTAKSHVSHAVESMVQAGFIERGADPDDQRLVRLYPTAKAKEHFEAVREAVHSRMKEVLSVIPDEQMQAIIEGLTLLRSVLRQETTQPDRS